MNTTTEPFDPDRIIRKRAVIDSEDFFQVLGVSREADRTAIKAAYLEAVRKFHPDRLAALGRLDLRQDAEYVFRRVSQAYATLSDDRRRAAYLEQLLRGEALSQGEVARTLAVERAVSEGEVAIKQRDYPRAITLLAEARRLDPAHGEAMALHAWARVKAGQATLVELRPIFEEAVRRAPRFARAHYYLGMALKQAGDLRRAIESFRRAVELDPNLTEAASEMRALQRLLGKDS